MAVALTTYHRVLRAILGDHDPDIHIYEDEVLSDMITAVINLNEVPGYQMSTDGLSVIQGALAPIHGYVDFSYQYLYGFNYNFAYANVYNQWYDQGFMYYINNPPQANAPDPGDLTPSGNPDGYSKLIWNVCNLFVVNRSNFHFKTRAVSESIDAPAELVFYIQQKIYDLSNGDQSSGRPAPLPLIAVGVRSLWGGLWGSYGLLFGTHGYDFAAF